MPFRIPLAMSSSFFTLASVIKPAFSKSVLQYLAIAAYSGYFLSLNFSVPVTTMAASS
jgi:hypothetical protein